MNSRISTPLPTVWQTAAEGVSRGPYAGAVNLIFRGRTDDVDGERHSTTVIHLVASQAVELAEALENAIAVATADDPPPAGDAA